MSASFSSWSSLNSQGPLSVTHRVSSAAFEVSLSPLLDVPHFHSQMQKPFVLMVD